jgi:hypothetical protein
LYLNAYRLSSLAPSPRTLKNELIFMKNGKNGMTKESNTYKLASLRTSEVGAVVTQFNPEV